MRVTSSTQSSQGDQAKSAANRGYLFTGGILEEKSRAFEFELTLSRLRTQVEAEEDRQLLVESRLPPRNTRRRRTTTA
jgi:hypothetical protein